MSKVRDLLGDSRSDVHDGFWRGLIQSDRLGKSNQELSVGSLIGVGIFCYGIVGLSADARKRNDRIP